MGECAFQYHLLRPRTTASEACDLVVEAYQCWKQVWQDTYRELDGIETLHSDEFLRQDEIGALFHGPTCVGLTAYRFVDLSLGIHRDDSYFRLWPDTAVKALMRDGARICIANQLTVRPEWRGLQQGVSIKHLLLGLMVRRFLDSSSNTMASVTRNDRNMNGLVYRHGAQSLVHRITLHGIDSDLVAFYRRSSIVLRDSLADDLWERVHQHGDRTNEGIAA